MDLNCRFLIFVMFYVCICARAPARDKYDRYPTVNALTPHRPKTKSITIKTVWIDGKLVEFNDTSLRQFKYKISDQDLYHTKHHKYRKNVYERAAPANDYFKATLEPDDADIRSTNPSQYDNKSIEKQPAYLDVEIEDSKSRRIAGLQDMGIPENITSTEINMLLCLYLHVLILSKKHQVINTNSVLNDMVHKEVYMHLSEQELLKEYHANCHEINHILRQEVQQIHDGRPKKHSLIQKETNKNNVDLDDTEKQYPDQETISTNISNINTSNTVFSNQSDQISNSNQTSINDNDSKIICNMCESNLSTLEIKALNYSHDISVNKNATIDDKILSTRSTSTLPKKSLTHINENVITSYPHLEVTTNNYEILPNEYTENYNENYNIITDNKIQTEADVSVPNYYMDYSTEAPEYVFSKERMTTFVDDEDYNTDHGSSEMSHILSQNNTKIFQLNETGFNALDYVTSDLDSSYIYDFPIPKESMNEKNIDSLNYVIEDNRNNYETIQPSIKLNESSNEVDSSKSETSDFEKPIRNNSFDFLRHDHGTAESSIVPKDIYSTTDNPTEMEVMETKDVANTIVIPENVKDVLKLKLSGNLSFLLNDDKLSTKSNQNTNNDMFIDVEGNFVCQQLNKSTKKSLILAIICKPPIS